MDKISVARGDDYLIDKIDKAISELVVPKYKLQKAYNYYDGFRDPEQYRYLEENFGIGSPTSIDFTPLIRKHVDALIGEYIDTPILPKVSCKDKETITKITREKELQISEEVFSYLRKHLNSSILSFINGKNTIDKSIEGAINMLVEDIDASFISKYETAAQEVITYVLQSRNTDFKNKLKALLLDLLVTGSTYYRVKPSVEKTNVDIEVLNPLNTFVDRNPESPYVRDSYRVVIRKWMTKQHILNKYGADLSKEAISKVEQLYDGYTESSHTYVRGFTNTCTGMPLTSGLDAGREVVPGCPTDSYTTYRLLPVFEVEWVEVDKEDGKWVMNRYEGVRISNEIYVLTGKSENIIRTKDNPSYCPLSVNGIFFVNRSMEPYSLVEACMPLQDKYDLITFFKDNLIANSGTSGDWLDLSMLPTVLGGDVTERIEKWIAYKKAGTAIVDTSQDGIQYNNNTSFAGYDDTLKAQAMQAFEFALDRVENTCSSITGVFRERLNGITQKDAVSNVQTGIQNSYTVTRQYYQQMDTLSTDMLLDCLNIGKIVWRKGLTGTLILGDELQRVFTALPKYFTVTDYDIHIQSSSEIMGEIKIVQQTVFEFIKSGGLDPDIVIEALTAKSLTDLKAKVRKAFAKRKQEADQTGQMQQQLEQAQQQLQQIQSQNQQLQSKIEQLNQAKIDNERFKIESENDREWRRIIAEEQYKKTSAENDTKRVEVEIGQLYDGNPYNNKVRQK